MGGDLPHPPHHRPGEDLGVNVGRDRSSGGGVTNLEFDHLRKSVLEALPDHFHLRREPDRLHQEQAPQVGVAAALADERIYSCSQALPMVGTSLGRSLNRGHEPATLLFQQRPEATLLGVEVRIESRF